ncbi:MAG: toprim domain-containing protein [Pseudomonadota bacterium]
MTIPASEMAQRLAREAETVCRYYLPNGRRHGRYWCVGDVLNTPGRSLYVRLSGSGTAGKWTDSATGDHGDLLDLIAANRALSLREAIAEAQSFLGLRQAADRQRSPSHFAPRPPIEAARRLWSMGDPIAGTLAGRYLARRGIAPPRSSDALRYHPDCFRRDLPAKKRPALLAKISAHDGTFQGVHRTWLDPATADKASIDVPRKAMGRLRGHGVWICAPADLVAAGEGLETVLLLGAAMPSLSVVAALSAGNLAALILPPGLRRLYVLVDDDRAGRWASESLVQRARAEGIDAVALVFPGGDANDALQRQGIEDFRASLRPQLCSEDVDRLLG